MRRTKILAALLLFSSFLIIGSVFAGGSIKNIAPEIEDIGDETILAGQVLEFSATAKDSNGDIFEFFDNSSLFDIDSSSGKVSFNTSLEDSGSREIEISAKETKHLTEWEIERSAKAVAIRNEYNHSIPTKIKKGNIFRYNVSNGDAAYVESLNFTVHDSGNDAYIKVFKELPNGTFQLVKTTHKNGKDNNKNKYDYITRCKNDCKNGKFVIYTSDAKMPFNVSKPLLTNKFDLHMIPINDTIKSFKFYVGNDPIYLADITWEARRDVEAGYLGKTFVGEGVGTLLNELPGFETYSDEKLENILNVIKSNRESVNVYISDDKLRSSLNSASFASSKKTFTLTVTKPECSDGIDNDGDNATDGKDFACSGDYDNDEGDILAACQDGEDNDNDTAIDLADIACSSTQDDDEGDILAVCQDGLDNDNDSFFDMDDPGCNSTQDDDEYHFIPECNNDKDDDGDNLIDSADPGCWDDSSNSSTYNESLDDESSATTACQDGLDNDGDGLFDLDDPGCENSFDNDESDGTSQCQDGLDNDNDSLIDLLDPGCWIDSTDPTTYDKRLKNESLATAQCQDGKDNDGDGVKDYPEDKSCESSLDNDEKYPLMQCQDGLDNDNDSLIDLLDPGCNSTQDDSEDTFTTQCQDGLDNDNDGLFDLDDPGCSEAIDDDESDGTSECQDGEDNDGDFAIDSDDPGCWIDSTNSSTYDKTLNDESIARPFDIFDLEHSPQIPGCKQDVDICADVLNLTDKVDFLKVLLTSVDGINVPFNMYHESGITYCKTGFSGTTLEASDGLVINYTVFGKDLSKNEDSESGSFTYDCAAPKIVVEGPANCSEGEIVEFDASKSSDSVSEELLYLWILDEGLEFDLDSMEIGKPAEKINLICTNYGEYDIDLWVYDEAGNNATKSLTLEVLNVPPRANANGPYRVENDYSILLDGEGDDLGTSPLEFSWDLDNDGIFEKTGEDTTFVCTENGTYNVSLKVSDGKDFDTDETFVECINITIPENKTECSDGLDNDNDSLIDLDDPGCSDLTDDDESDDPSPVTECSDGLDNDNDGLFDLDDPDCSDLTDDTESGSIGIPECMDGEDNDDDGDIDYPEDSGCDDRFDDREKRGTSKGGGSGGDRDCEVDWYCTSWSLCSEGQQIRECRDLNKCGSNNKRPSFVQRCELKSVLQDETIQLGGPLNKDFSYSTTTTSNDLNGFPWWIWTLIISILALLILIIIVGIAKALS